MEEGGTRGGGREQPKIKVKRGEEREGRGLVRGIKSSPGCDHMILKAQRLKLTHKDIFQGVL